MSDHVEHTFSCGSVVRGTPEMVALSARIDAHMQGEAADATRYLREQGVKAAHPDDGWVNREKNTVRLEYPLFNDKPQVGDLIGLGQPWKTYRLVRVTELEYLGTTDSKLLTFYGMSRDEPWCYHFELVVEEREESMSKKPWWRFW